MNILKLRTQWQSQYSKNHFESGALMGTGAINLILSHLPSRVMKLLQLIGFSGDRSNGLNYLNQAADNTESLRFAHSQILILAYDCYMEQFLGLGKGDLDNVDRLVEKGLKQFPNVIINFV